MARVLFFPLLVVAAALSGVTASTLPRRLSSTDRKSIAWVASNFPLRLQEKCDATWYHSPLAINISRPNLNTFCFIVSAKPATGKYSCQKSPYPGQVSTVQIMTGATCGNAISVVGVDGAAWPHVSFNNATSLLTISRLDTAPTSDTGAGPSDHVVCIALDPQHPNCSSLATFCAPTYSSEPACGILIADSTGDCCPVNRVGYGTVPLRTSVNFQFTARVTGLLYGCDQITNDPAVAADVTSRIALQYARALYGSTSADVSGRFTFQALQCRGGRLTAVLRAAGLTGTAPEAIVSRSAMLLKPVAAALGLEGVKVSPYVPRPPPPSPPSRPGKPRASKASPPPPPPQTPEPSSSPAGQPGSPPPAPAYGGAAPPPVYGSQPPVYGH